MGTVNDSPAWIGRWWSGYLICMVLYALAAIPFFFFPRHIRTASTTTTTTTTTTAIGGATTPRNSSAPALTAPPDRSGNAVAQRGWPTSGSSSTAAITTSPSGGDVSLSESPTVSSEQIQRSTTPTQMSDAGSEFGRNIKDIPFSVLRLFKNSGYMLACASACVDVAIISGLTVFLPKYLETQFQLSKSNASALTGSVAIPGACVGIFLGGWLLKRFKIQLGEAARLIVVFSFITFTFFSLFFFLGCDNLRVAGITIPYAQPLEKLLVNPPKQSTLNLTVPCNMPCNCDLDNYFPICGVDHMTYFSPCFASCTAFAERPKDKVKPAPDTIRKTKTEQFFDKLFDKDDNRTYFSGCSCISTKFIYSNQTMVDSGGTGRYEAHDGTCENTCRMLVPFLLMLFFLTFFGSIGQMPMVMVTLRTVSEEEKAFALGLQVVMLRLFGYIPAPIIFGFIIDTTCLVWKEVCGQDATHCLLHDIQAFRFRYISIAMALKFIGCSLNVALWLCIKKRFIPFSPPVTMSEIAHRLGSSENLHLRHCPTHGLRPSLSDDSLYTTHRNLQNQSDHKSPKRHKKNQSC